MGTVVYQEVAVLSKAEVVWRTPGRAWQIPSAPAIPAREVCVEIQGKVAWAPVLAVL